MRFCLLFLLLFLNCQSFAQDFNLQSFNERRDEISKRGMFALGGWATTNFVVSGVLSSQRKGEERAFHEMNIYWNSVNAALAISGLLQIRKNQGNEKDFLKSIEEQQSLEKVLLFNAGLDIAYMLGGAYLIQRGKYTSNLSQANQFKGFGQSLLLQGGFLFVYDVLMYRSHHRNWKKSGIRDELQILPRASGVSIIYRF